MQPLFNTHIDTHNFEMTIKCGYYSRCTISPSEYSICIFLLHVVDVWYCSKTTSCLTREYTVCNLSVWSTEILEFTLTKACCSIYSYAILLSQMLASVKLPLSGNVPCRIE